MFVFGSSYIYSKCTPVFQPAASASVSIEEDVMVATQLLGAVSYFQYELPDEGLTLRLNVAEGRVVMYASTKIRNPNSALYDIRLETDATEDVFVSPDDLIITGAGMRVKRRRNSNEEGEGNSTVRMIFVTVEGLENNNSYILETHFGDTSTSEYRLFVPSINYCVFVSMQQYKSVQE